MLYMPATTLAAPMVLHGAQPAPLPATTRYYMMPPTATTVLPTVPFANTAFVYPSYGLISNPVEKDKSQIQAVTEHVVHHHVPACSVQTCACCCGCECAREEEPARCRSRSRSRSRSPSTHEEERCSRRHQFIQSTYDTKIYDINLKIEALRRELHLTPASKQEKATGTVDYYGPPPKPRPVTPPTPYVPSPDWPKPRPPTPSRCRSRSRSRSGSRKRSSSLPREPWRSTNQNDYTWRDAHLPAYREATLAREQAPVNDTQRWKETTHERSYSAIGCVNPCHTITDYSYRPNTTTDYTCRPTSATPAVCSGTRVYNYAAPSTSACGHSFYSDVPTATRTHHLKKIDATPSHNLYGCNDPCLHVVPKQGSASEPPYMKIYNAPVTYLH